MDGKKIIQSFLSIACKQLQSFSNSEILNMIPPDVLEKIKEKDPNPFFQAYSICHEGNTIPTIIGEGPKPISWTKKAIQSLKNIVTKGIKFFLGHNKDNSTEGREELGEVVADTQQEIDGILHHIVVGYFPDKEKVIETDICSQEADWDLFETGKNYIADKITKLTGIALGNSEYEQPAFKGAKRLGMIQAFENDGDTINKNKGVHDMDLSAIDYTIIAEELKRRVVGRNLKPSQIFSLDDIKADKDCDSIFRETEQGNVKIKELEDKIKTLEDDKITLGTQVQVSTASKRFDKLIDNQVAPLTEKQKAFIKSSFSARLDSNKISDVTDEGLQTFVTNRLEDYKIDVENKLINDEVVDPQLNVDTKNIQVDKNDLTKKVNNPLLKTDFEMD